MAKTKLFAKDIPVTFNLSQVVVEDYVRGAIDREVEKAVETAVTDAVSEAVTKLVDRIGQERVGKEIERVMEEGWPRTNQYGERSQWANNRVQLWSCGGGRQSAGIAALIVEGQLPKPDHVAMVALEREFRQVWPYVNRYIRPALNALGIPFTAIARKDYSTAGFFGGREGRSLLLPAYSDLSGSPSKLSEFCSGKWKRDVMTSPRAGGATRPSSRA